MLAWSTSVSSTKPGEAEPRVVGCERPLAGRHDRLEGLLEDRVDQVVPGREVAVQRGHPDARLTGDLAHRHVDPVARQEDARRGDQPGAVPLRVDAIGDGHGGNLAENGTGAPFESGQPNASVRLRCAATL